MSFTMDAEGISVQLTIRGYEPSCRENWDDQWCKCDFTFRSGDWLNYHKENDEVFLSCEVEALEGMLSKMLNNQLEEEKELGFIEPDFEFHFYPQQEFTNIGCEWRIYFWDDEGALTCNYLAITLSREDMEALRDYLLHVMKAGSFNMPEEHERQSHIPE